MAYKPRPSIWMSAALVALMLAVPTAGEDGSSEKRLYAAINAIPPYRPASTEVSGTVRIFASTSMDAMAHGWSRGFKEFHKSAGVEIYGATSQQALEQLVKQPESIVMLARPIHDDEIQALKKAGLKNPVAIPVAREALAVYVHESNPVSTIDGKQLKSIFTNCEYTPKLSWGLLNASEPFASRPIHLLSRTQACGTQKYLRDFVFGSVEMRDGKEAFESNALLLAKVREDPLAIAICGKRSQASQVKMLKLVAGAKEIPSDDLAILTGQYPLTRTLSVVIDTGSQGSDALSSREFVRYALGQKAQQHTLIDGYYPLAPNLMQASVNALNTPSIR